MCPYRLLIVDDHPIVLSGLKLLLAGANRFVLCGEAGSAALACAEAVRLQPDVVVTDLTRGEGDGLTLIRAIRGLLPAVRIVVYSSRDEAFWAPAAIRVGAHGYVAKSEPLDSVAVALDRVMMGEIHPGASVAQMSAAARMCAAEPPIRLVDLSPRERQVLLLSGEGATLQAAASILALSVKTIGTYRERLKVKLGLESSRALHRYAADYVAGRLDLP